VAIDSNLLRLFERDPYPERIRPDFDPKEQRELVRENRTGRDAKPFVMVLRSFGFRRRWSDVHQEWQWAHPILRLAYGKDDVFAQFARPADMDRYLRERVVEERLLALGVPKVQVREAVRLERFR
jgi:hypothetical protein